MRLLAWNLNHRARPRVVPEGVSRAIAALAPDVAVLTEYVSRNSHERFIGQLAALGLPHAMASGKVPGQNQVLVASRQRFERGSLRAPDIEPAFPPNVLHVTLPEAGVGILAMRVPDYSHKAPLRRACWDWIESTAATVRHAPFVILGDLNIDPGYPPKQCGDRIPRLVASGWHWALPPQGGSFWPLKGGTPKRLDHAVVTRHFHRVSAAYVEEVDGIRLGARGGRGALSDHAALVVELSLEP